MLELCQPGWVRRRGTWRCSLPEADDSSVFVVGTVLYRNLGSFLALQRWVLGAGGGVGHMGEAGPGPAEVAAAATWGSDEGALGRGRRAGRLPAP